MVTKKRTAPRKNKAKSIARDAAPARPQTAVTREGWLEEACLLLLPRIRQAAAWAGVPCLLTTPPAVSCSWAAGRSTKALVSSTKAGKGYEISLSPVVGEGWEKQGNKGDYSTAALALLAHELVHCATGEALHKGAFLMVAQAIGLAMPYAKATAGDGLLHLLDTELLPTLGAYPHTSVAPPAAKKGQNRQKKYVCANCGKIIRCAGGLSALHLCADGKKSPFVAAEKS